MRTKKAIRFKKKFTHKITMNLYEKVFYSIILGAVITLASSLLPNTGGGIGIQGSGFPFPWMIQAIYPGAPLTIDWIGLILDVTIWTFIALLIVQIYGYFQKGNEA